MRSIFNQNSLEEAQEKLRLVVTKYTTIDKHLALNGWKRISQNRLHILSIFKNKSHIWSKIRTSDGLEQLNQEVKRRTKIVRVFPNAESTERLVGTVLIEFNDGWISNKKYINWDKSDDDFE